MYDKESRVEKYQKVLEFVKKERVRRNIKEEDLCRGAKSELSGEAYGDGYLLVERQLMYTKESCEETWGLLRRNPVMLTIAFNYAVFGLRSGTLND